MKPFFEGLLLQASLIIALGAQNIFVLESGLKKQRQFLVATICSACDFLLTMLGVVGAASLFVQVPSLKIGFGILGVAFLAYYGFKKISEGFKKQVVAHGEGAPRSSIKQVIILTLSFSLLNPHVYLDTLVLIGGYSAKFSHLSHRIFFGLGASAMSVLWFFGLTLFTTSIAGILNSPKAMQRIALVSGLILVSLSIKLGLNVYSWIVFRA